MKCPCMWHFIWVFTVWQNTHLLVSRMKSILGKNKFVHFSMRNDKDILYKLLKYFHLVCITFILDSDIDLLHLKMPKVYDFFVILSAIAFKKRVWVLLQVCKKSFVCNQQRQDQLVHSDQYLCYICSLVRIITKLTVCKISSL